MTEPIAEIRSGTRERFVALRNAHAFRYAAIGARVAAVLGFSLAAIGRVAATEPADWQWSVPMGEGRAFLWIPPACERVRAVIVGQNNMLEEGILERPAMRRVLGELGIAEVFVAPPFDPVFQFDRGAGERFERMLRALAEESGYGELAHAPVIPIGHSACASYPWNFAAWNPGRTLALLSIKGDAPQTDLTGSGRPNPEWGNRVIDGIPGLMVMSEAEWWDARLAPLLRFRAAHPGAPLAVLADTGHGHFDASDRLVEFLALFIRKAAGARLPGESSAGVPPAGSKNAGGTPALLRPIDPAAGWLMDRWRRDEAPRGAVASVKAYRGDPAEAFWCFDEEHARATEAYHATSRGKKPQQVDVVQAGAFVPIATSHAGVELQFLPEADGVSFRMSGGFVTPLPPKPPLAAKDKAPPVQIVKPTAAAATDHADGAVRISRITGPVTHIEGETWRVALNRTAATTDRRGLDAWLLAEHPGNGEFKGAVQQALLRVVANVAGSEQRIEFPAIADQQADVNSLRLGATSSAGLPVSYYVREGPAEVEGDTLRFTALPPRARLPLKVTVVAWQWGRGGEHAVKTAEPVERSFSIIP